MTRLTSEKVNTVSDEDRLRGGGSPSTSGLGRKFALGTVFCSCE
jgi:hypothetical protein